MPLQFIDLIVETRENLRVGDDQDARIRRWINRMQRRLASTYNWRWLETTVDFTSTTTQPNAYTLPTDFKSPLDIRFRSSSSDWTKITVFYTESIDDRFPNPDDQGNVPIRAYFTGNTFVLHPGVDNTNSLIRLRYQRTPPDLVGDSDVPLVPDTFRDTLVDGATYLGSRFLWNDKGEQDRIKRDFQEGLADLLRTETGPRPQTQIFGIEQGQADLLTESGTV